MLIDILKIILYIATVVVIVYELNKKLFPYLNEKNEIKNKEAMNQKYELFKTIDPSALKESLDNYFEEYVNRYITYKFLSKKIMYIKAEESEAMVKDLTKLIYLEISDMYIFYIKCNTSINDDEQLLQYIHNKVQNTCIEIVTNYNSSMTI